MITRTLRGLGALALIALALIGWPAALLGLTDAVAVWLPDLSDPGALLSRPDTGGLFLVIVLALGWIAWVVWTVALIVEVAAQVRGVPTPHLGGLFPQNATAALVTAIAVAFTIAPSTPATAGTTGAAATPASTSVSQMVVDRSAATRHRDPAVTAPTASADFSDEAEEGDYTVVRGDTLWDIADEQLDDPTRYPEIAQASQGITQPDGRHLTDPDLILPGWTLHVPTDQAETAEAAPPVNEPVAEAEPVEVPSPASAEDSPTPGEQVVPPPTPLSAPASPASTPTRGGPALSAAAPAPPVTPALPVTPMNATGGPPAERSPGRPG